MIADPSSLGRIAENNTVLIHDDARKIAVEGMSRYIPVGGVGLDQPARDEHVRLRRELMPPGPAGRP